MIFPETHFGKYVEEDEWTAEFGAGQRCPKCGAPDYHLDPSGPNGEDWEVCESCGYSVDAETGEVMIEEGSWMKKEVSDD